MRRRYFMQTMLGTVAMLFHAVARAEGSDRDGLFAKVGSIKPESKQATLTLEVMPKETRFIVEGDTDGLVDGETVQFHIKDSDAVWSHHRMKVTNVQFVP